MDFDAAGTNVSERLGGKDRQGFGAEGILGTSRRVNFAGRDHARNTTEETAFD